MAHVWSECERRFGLAEPEIEPLFASDPEEFEKPSIKNVLSLADLSPDMAQGFLPLTSTACGDTAGIYRTPELARSVIVGVDVYESRHFVMCNSVAEFSRNPDRFAMTDRTLTPEDVPAALRVCEFVPDHRNIRGEQDVTRSWAFLRGITFSKYFPRLLGRFRGSSERDDWIRSCFQEPEDFLDEQAWRTRREAQRCRPFLVRRAMCGQPCRSDDGLSRSLGFRSPGNLGACRVASEAAGRHPRIRAASHVPACRRVSGATRPRSRGKEAAAPSLKKRPAPCGEPARLMSP